MTKSEYLNVLIPELKRLHEVEHLRDLVRNGRYDEAQTVIDNIEYSSLDEYCYDYRDGEHFCRLAVSDIPKKYLVTFTLYLSGSEDYNELDIMECCKELQEAVAEQGEDGAIIARAMDNYVLNNFRTIAELMEAA